jgi:hypothetical protein
MNTNHTGRRKSERVRFILVHLCLIFLMLTLSSVSVPAQSSSEDMALRAVSGATNAAARMAAAEYFVANFPQSTQRPNVAKLVAEQLTTLRNPQIALALLERARAIFISPAELECLEPAALEIYANSNRADEAFALASVLLAKKPYEFWILLKMTYLGAQEARKKNLKYAESTLEYASRAIAIVESEKRPAGITDEAWTEDKAKLSGLYQQIGIINLAQGKTNEAKAQIVKATQLGPHDPAGFALLARLMDDEYKIVLAAYQAMTEGALKQAEKNKLDIRIDEIIDAYARAAGLATGKSEYLRLLQQVIPDLTNHYKYRHNESIAGLQQLINRYRYSQNTER